MIPPGALPHGSTVVALAVSAGVTYHDDLMAVTGMSRGGVHSALVRLRDDGLIDWDDGKRGTIHALYGVVR